MRNTVALLAGFFLLVGLASMWQAVKNARTSTDVETGRWFTIGLIMAAGSAAVIWFMFF
jgi:hypothetical protein